MYRKYLGTDQNTWNQRRLIVEHNRCSIHTLCDIPSRYRTDLR